MTLHHRLARKLAISTSSFVVLFVVAELVARALEPGPFSLLDENPYEPHAGVHHVHKPDFAGRWDSSWYATDSRGFRGPELDLRFAEDEFRVACVGDSCTFGKGVREEESWPRQLERLLAQEAAGRWRPVVANLGVNGLSGRDYMRLFRERGLSLRPHLVVVGYNLNDFPNAIKAVDAKVYGEQGMRRFLAKDLRDFMGRFACYRLARATYYHMNRERDWRHAEAFAAGAAEAELDSEVWRQQRSFLEGIRDDAAAAGARTAVFLFPYESQVYLDGFNQAPIERLREICALLDVPFVDLAASFREVARDEPDARLFLRGDRYHPSARGYGIVARQVLELARGQGWLPAE